MKQSQDAMPGSQQQEVVPHCVKCKREALYVVTSDGTLLCEECTPSVKVRLSDWFHKIVRPLRHNTEVSEGGTRDSRIETAAQSRPSLH